MNHNKNSVDIVFTFLCDTIFGAVLFVGIFTVAILLSQFLTLWEMEFDGIKAMLFVATALKYLMFTIDSIIFLYFIIQQGWYGFSEMRRYYEEIN
jgi:hypothetical protein